MNATQIELIIMIHQRFRSLENAIYSAVETNSSSSAITILDEVQQMVNQLKEQATGDEEN
jgi:hypothetical protein